MRWIQYLCHSESKYLPSNNSTKQYVQKFLDHDLRVGTLKIKFFQISLNGIGFTPVKCKKYRTSDWSRDH